MKRNTIFGLIIALSAVSLSGCFYSFNPKGKLDISSVAIERFQNNTAEFGIEDQMTDAVIDAFIADGTMRVLPKEQAEAILEGTLLRYNHKPYEYDESDQVKSYVVEMDFDIHLKKPADNSDFWNETMSQRGVYDLLTETEEDARLKAIDLLVEAIINRTTKSW
jgi:hypothetical protein